jgi:MscS family membrane protein
MVLATLNEIFGFAFLGSTFFQYAQLLVVILISWILGQVVSFIVLKLGGKLAAKTKNEFDDLLIEAAAKPIGFFFVIAGIYAGSQFLTPTNPAVMSGIINVIGMLIIFNIAWFLIRIVDGFIHVFIKPLAEKTESKFDDQIIPVLSKISKFAIALIALILVLDNFGFDVITLLAGLGIAGVAVAFAAQETISDVFGGISIFASRPFVVGDQIEIDSTLGTVEQVGLRYTRIRDLDGRVNVYPNRKIATGIVKNWTSEPSRRIKMNLGVTYGTSTEKLDKGMGLIRKIISDNAMATKDIRISFNEFKDSSLNILVIYFVKSNDIVEIMKVQNEINLAIKKSFEKEGIEFAFPTQTVYLKK